MTDSPWGANPAGLTWECTGDADFSRGAGRIGLTPGATGVAMLPADVRDIDATVLASVNQMATGGWITAEVRIRQSAESRLTVNLELKDTGMYGIACYEIVDGSVTQLGGAELGSYTAGHHYRLRIQAVGDTVQARVWDTDEPEYEHWQVVARIENVMSPGRTGLAASAMADNTNTDPLVTFRQFDIPNPQAFWVTRSVNGVQKLHKAGTDVRLTNPLVLAL